MKKLFALALVVFGLAACQTDPEGLDVNVGGEVDTTITVSLPETTRANSALGAFENVNLGTEDDNKTIRYILQVYYKGEPSQERLVKYSDGKSVAFDVRLVSGRDYQFVAWADYVESKDDTDLHYNTANLKNVTLNRTWVAMDETRDAFTATKEVEYRSATAIDLELKRPFAKLRIITTDMEALNNIGIEPTKATVEYDVDHYNAFNAFEGKAIADSKNRDIKHEKFAIKAYDDNVVDESKVLFTDYFFAENDVVKFYLTVFDQNGEVIGETIAFNTDINVKRNYVTTISGNILTDRNNVNVTVKDAFDNADSLEEEPYYKEIVEVGNAADLQEAINNSTEETMIVLGGDIVLGDEAIELAATRAAVDYALLVPAGKVVNLNLNGKTISHEKECTASYEMILNKGNLTITGNGKLSFKDTSAGDPTYGWGSYTLRNEGTLVVENGTIEHLGEQDAHMICAIFQYSGHSTINGGKISTPNYRSARLWSGDMTINGGEFEGQLWLQAVNDTSDLTINGGTFAPRGDDSSSVFVTNTGKDVKFAVNGGNFTTKIGMSVPFACITGGTFTADAKSGTNAALLANGYFFEKAGENYVVSRTSEAKVGSIIDINGVKAVIFSLENGMKAVSVEQGGEMLWDESMEWAQNLGDGWSLASLSELQAIHAVRETLNEALAADDANNALFEEDDREEDGSYAAYWSSTLVEGSTNKAHYLYFDNDATVMSSFTMFPVEYSRAVYNLGYYNVGDVVEVAGQKGVVFSVENGVKVVSVAELNLNGKYWQDAIDWAAGLGNGWSLASMEDLNAIYDLRCELNDALEAENAENALFWEGDELYIKNGSVYYALYMSCDEVPAGEKDANGNEYWENRVFFKKFNKLGYSDVLYSAFDCINKYAPLRDNYFARATYSIAR